MTFTRKTYREITEDMLMQLTKGVTKEKHIFTEDRFKYLLSDKEVRDIIKVEGVSKGMPVVFKKDIDYKLNNDMAEWISDDIPDAGTEFYVSYCFGEPSLITDINPGSVARTIVEATAREIEFLHSQLNYVYLSGFIETANGNALDLVVSILGITRKSPSYATGYVSFGRNLPPSEITRNGEAHVYDGKKFYSLKNSPVKNILSIKGDVNKEQYTFIKETDYLLKDDLIIWLATGKKPDTNSIFYVDYVCYEEIKIPKGTNVSTYSRDPKNMRVFETANDEILKISPDGKWEVDVPVRAIVSGKEGNVYAGTIILMPQPPRGIEYVTNKKDILNGTEAESDEELRNRAKHALQVAGKATLISLKSAIEGVKGVRSVRIEDMPDDVPGIVKAIVSGGNEEEIRKVIEDTRAAGIKVEFERPKIIDIDISITAVLNKGVEPLLIEKNIELKVKDYISSLNIGEEVVYSKIMNIAISVEGVYDTSDITINNGKENIKIKPEEMVEVRAIKILTKFKD